MGFFIIPLSFITGSPLKSVHIDQHQSPGIILYAIRVITKLPNSEQSNKGKVKTHKYIYRQNQSTTKNYENRNDPDLLQAFLKK